jgi:hypothetical protein
MPAVTALRMKPYATRHRVGAFDCAVLICAQPGRRTTLKL